MKAIPLIIMVLWIVALALGVFGVVTRRKTLIIFGGVAALAGVALTYWLKSLLKTM